MKSAQDFPDFRKFPKNPNFEIEISRRLLDGFQKKMMIMKGETQLFPENRVRTFGEVFFDIFGWGKDSVFSENPLSQPHKGEGQDFRNKYKVVSHSHREQARW